MHSLSAVRLCFLHFHWNEALFRQPYGSLFLWDFLALGLKADSDADKSAELWLKCFF